ncbi:MAG: hypothetical protein U9R03_04415 [Candidatus Aerophobetes bacterium]|nr:hypothetical protein [Candidatus Aerophobetes bacterium]
MSFGLDDTTDLLSGGNPLENAIADIPVPSVPDTPSMLDFENFSTGTACIDAEAKHTVLTLKLNSSHLGGEALVDIIKPTLEAMLGMDESSFEIPKFSDLNMDLSLSKISTPKIGDLPQCLSDILTGNLSTEGQGLTGDILDNTNSTISGLTSVIQGPVNYTLNSFTGDMNPIVSEANLMLNKMVGSILDPKDKIFFEKLDDLYKYLKNTDYIEDYKNWKNMTKCIQTNCKPIVETIMDDDFMWYDDKKKEFIMPIDLVDSRIRIRKFFQSLTQEESRKCVEIEKRYYKYLRDKEQLARQASEKLRLQNIKDDKNPFMIIISSMKF